VQLYPLSPSLCTGTCSHVYFIIRLVNNNVCNITLSLLASLFVRLLPTIILLYHVHLMGTFFFFFHCQRSCIHLHVYFIIRLVNNNVCNITLSLLASSFVRLLPTIILLYHVHVMGTFFFFFHCQISCIHQITATDTTFTKYVVCAPSMCRYSRYS